MLEDRSAFKVLTGKLQVRNFWASPGVGGRTILEWIFKKYE
jgi:hypothetical protein